MQKPIVVELLKNVKEKKKLTECSYTNNNSIKLTGMKSRIEQASN